MPYILNGFFRAKANKKSELAPNRQAREAEVTVYDDIDDNDKTRRNVFDDKVSPIFEERAKHTGKILQRQSERNLRRTYFSQGILPSKGKQKNDSKNWLRMNKVVL